MVNLILTVAIHYEQDVVLARQRGRQLAGLLGFDRQDEVRIATALSEIARNAFQYARNGKVEFSFVEGPPPVFRIRVVDEGNGIPDLQAVLEDRYTSKTGLGLGIRGARRLVDNFNIASAPGKGTEVILEKRFPRGAAPLGAGGLAAVAEKLARDVVYDPFAELQRQNQELLAALDELNARQRQLAMLNKELEDTNRGVVALYAELDERSDEFRRTSDLKTQFLSNMSHEFRTPLNSILSLSRILLEQVDGALNDEQQKQVHFIVDAASSLTEIVNDMLDLAKVEAGKVQIRPGEFTVHGLFGALRGMLRPLLTNNSVQLIFVDPVDVPPLYTDESKVSQILRNFISNALKFTEQGEVRVSAHLTPDGDVMFSVADTGIGIPLQHQTRVFEEYVQVEGPHQKGKRGTGLGLALSKRLAHLLGGSLSLQSAPGNGSTFHLTLPPNYSGPAEVAYAQPEAPQELDPTRLPLLIVEDNLETQFIYEKMLKGTGFQPVPARTLREARLALSQFRPAAIFLDILLSKENSWAFLVELKTSPGTSNIPVFVVTIVDNRDKALELGADDFSTKPLNRSWMLNKLGTVENSYPRRELLIIDDDEVSRYLLKGRLNDMFARVIEASGGEEGIRLAQARQPAAIFLDLMMPDMDGHEVLRRLKSSENTRSIPVIVYSANCLTPDERAILEDKAVAFIEKNPAEGESTLGQIRKALVNARVVAYSFVKEPHEE